jgi:hypothetical protein
LEQKVRSGSTLSKLVPLIGKAEGLTGTHLEGSALFIYFGQDRVGLRHDRNFFPSLSIDESEVKKHAEEDAF